MSSSTANQVAATVYGCDLYILKYEYHIPFFYILQKNKLMKKKLYLLGAIVLLVSLSSYPQTADLGDVYSLPKKHMDAGFYGNPKDGYVNISVKPGEDLTIQHFSPDLKLTKERSISSDSFPKDYVIEKIIVMGGKCFLLYSTEDYEERLWAQEINLKNGALIGKARQIAGSKEKIKGLPASMLGYHILFGDNSPKWQFRTSADESKLLIYYRLKTKAKMRHGNEIIGFYVLDTILNKIWSREATMPYPLKMMDNDAYQVDYKGNAYVLGKIYEDGDKESNDAHPNYHYELLVYSADSTSNVTAKFDIGGKHVLDAALKEDINGRIIYAGYYSKNEKAVNFFLTKAVNTDGVFLLTFDEGTKSLKNLYKDFYEFPSKVENLQLRNLVISDDGSISLFGEQYYKTTTTRMVNSMGGPSISGFGHTGSMGGAATTGSVSDTRYCYDDIYAMKIGANGELNWVKKIPKRQRDISQQGNAATGTPFVGANTEYLSFYLHTVGKNSYLFFIDDSKNLDLSPDKEPAKYSAGADGELVCVKIDEKGNTTKTNLYGGIDMRTKVILSKMNDVAPHQILGRVSSGSSGFLIGNFSEGRPMMITVE